MIVDANKKIYFGKLTWKKFLDAEYSLFNMVVARGQNIRLNLGNAIEYRIHPTTETDVGEATAVFMSCHIINNMSTFNQKLGLLDNIQYKEQCGKLFTLKCGL